MTIAELTALVGGSAPEWRMDAEVTRVASPADAGVDAIVFAAEDTALQAALASAAGVVLARMEAVGEDARLVRVGDPRFAFALCGKALREQGRSDDEAAIVHPTAVVDATATLGARTRVGAGAVIEAGVVLGADCVVGSNVTLAHDVRIGDRVVVQAGAVLGATGFGYARDAATGEYVLFPQQGGLVIEDDVEIGANTTIDRGALGETRIGRGTKIDNLVHIAHNCRIGRNVVIAAQVGIAGSSVVGDGVMLGGQAGLGDHVHIGDGVILGGQGGVYPGATVEGVGQVFTGTPAQPVREHLRGLAKMRRLK